MIRHIAILTFNDLAISIKNKSIFLVIFIPLFVFVAMSFIDKADGDFQKINIGLVHNNYYEPKIIRRVTAAGEAVGAAINVTWIDNREAGIALLNEHALDAVVVDSEKSPGRLGLLVLRKESPHTQAVVEILSALQKAEEGGRASWIADVEPLHEGGIQRQALPIWILMLVLLVSFIVIPAQVAEEKEKKLLLALLQTPVGEMEWLIAKLITGIVLIGTSVLLLHLLGQFGRFDFFAYAAFILVGGFCFSAFGVFLGFLCRNQASARTLGLIFYLPMLLPSALSDVSQKLTSVAPFLPSYQLYMPIRAILLEDGGMSSLFSDWIYLLILGIVMFFMAFFLIKKRWLMS